MDMVSDRPGIKSCSFRIPGHKVVTIPVVNGFAMKVTRFGRITRAARFLIPNFGATKVADETSITLNGDGNRKAVIFQGVGYTSYTIVGATF
ncbi:hypothetical protein RJ640_007321 [Escallonia rubra]|uniref:Uncharacterized protein n=1 Tax=Escallonia rubra TaxID=112253 RepID=A0AA88R7E3_9ASTE|nr:hypothetical protein RJ640_007321 [Escallonia rubra]